MNKYNDYCTGCGLCKSIMPNDVKESHDNFTWYEPISDDSVSLCEKICPAFGNQSSSLSTKDIWGHRLETVFSYSLDSDIRKLGSSGGTLTSLALFLIEQKLVDGIIHVCDQSALTKKIVCSNTRNQIISSAGSKYIDSSNLLDIMQLINPNKKYCFIGKPCDVSILKEYSKYNQIIKDCIVYYFSFFCAGSPSVSANERLLNHLGCNPQNVSKIIYRGNGWPGEFVAIDKEGKEYKTDYNSSWGRYLGRDIRKICRFCIDGIGEQADISCADAWYVKDNAPDFSEHAGRNITFVRTNAGSSIFNEAQKMGYLESFNCDDVFDYLKTIQNYQFIRRATMHSTLLALRICGRGVPKYNSRLLSSYSKNISTSDRLKRFLGTIKRVIQKKI